MYCVHIVALHHLFFVALDQLGVTQQVILYLTLVYITLQDDVKQASNDIPLGK